MPTGRCLAKMSDSDQRLSPWNLTGRYIHDSTYWVYWSLFSKPFMQVTQVLLWFQDFESHTPMPKFRVNNPKFKRLKKKKIKSRSPLFKFRIKKIQNTIQKFKSVIESFQTKTRWIKFPTQTNAFLHGISIDHTLFYNREFRFPIESINQIQAYMERNFNK